MSLTSTSTGITCTCGLHHPENFFCQRGAGRVTGQANTKKICCPTHELEERQEVRKKITEKEGENEDELPHSHGSVSCCPSENGQTEPVKKSCSLPDKHGPAHHMGEKICCAHNHTPFSPEPSTLKEASTTRAIYRIMNMDCPMEEALIRKKLGSMPGIKGLEFNLMQRVLTVDHNLPSTKPIETALLSIEMKPEALGTDQATSALPDAQIPWARLTLAGIFGLASEFAELLPELGETLFGISAPENGIHLMEWLPLGLALVAIFLGGLGTYRKGWIALKNLNLNINALMSVAVTGALIIGHYPEAAMVMVLFNLAEAIEAKSLDRARKAIKGLLDLAPEKATVLHPDGTWTEMDSKGVPIGSRVRVRPGERIALDGLIVQGRSTVNQAPITGESLPVEKSAGDTVYAGTINESGSFEFTVTAGFNNSTLSRIIHTVEEAQDSRAPIQRFMDQFARIYTPLVFLFALLLAFIPPLLLGASWQEWVYMALVVLVIGCPCALVISTPVTIVSAMAAATRHGILIKGGSYLEQGRLLQWVALDKTGTLTHGKPVQTNFVDLSHGNAEQIVQIAASLALRSDHPVSRAIADKAGTQGISFLEIHDFTAVPGQGIHGTIKGTRWYLGNHKMMREIGKYSGELEEKISFLEKQGKSVVALAGEKEVQGLFAVADTLKESSVEAIRELKSLGIRTMMLTGDNVHTAEAIAEHAGVDHFKGALLPEDKLAQIERMGESGKVGMVGDGINDAPALARADIGFAMAAAGTDTAIETADVALMDDDLKKIPRFIRLSKSTHAILMQNITFALGIKALFFGLTFTGHATMWMAVFADVGASLLVVANGLRAMHK